MQARTKRLSPEEIKQARCVLLAIDPADKDYPQAWAAFVRLRNIDRELRVEAIRSRTAMQSPRRRTLSSSSTGLHARGALPLAVRHQLEGRSKALRERQRLGVVNGGKRCRDSRRSNREQGNYENQTAHVRLLCELEPIIEMGRLCFRTVSWTRKLISLKRL
ncbi:hypothetical protein ACFDR1_19090 [Bradyrhizobium sp. 1AS5L]